MTDTVTSKVNAIASAMGFTPSRVYFENTAFLLGWEISNDRCHLIYRAEGDTLLICSLEARRPRQGLENVLLPLMRLWRQTVAQAPDIMRMKAMIRQTGSEEARLVRQKMVAFLQLQGGQVVWDGEDQWVELPR